MIPLSYKERYKRILQKDKITKEEVNQFKEDVKHITEVFPDWNKMQIH